MRALVLLPTRELADQVAQQIKLYAQHTQLRSTVVFGGVDMKPQSAELKGGVEVLINNARAKFDEQLNFTDEQGRDFMRQQLAAFAQWIHRLQAGLGRGLRQLARITHQVIHPRLRRIREHCLGIHVPFLHEPLIGPARQRSTMRAKLL